MCCFVVGMLFGRVFYKGEETVFIKRLKIFILALIAVIFVSLLIVLFATSIEDIDFEENMNC
jgi:hypothetical protein